VRPAWQVAGVDFAVGVPSQITLTPWRSAHVANVDFNLSSGRVSCSSRGANVVIDGIDFTAAPGAYIYDTNDCHWTIQNSKFGCPNAYSGIIGDSLTILHSELNQTGCPRVSSFITGGPVVAKYNWFRNGSQHVIETGGPGALDQEYNLIDTTVPGGAATGSHENFQQLTGTAMISSSVIAYNTVHQPAGGNGEGWQFYCNAGPCQLVNPTIRNNTVVTLPGANMSYIVHGSENVVLNGVNRDNFFDLRGAFGAYYPGTMTPARGWTSSGNIDLNTGRAITPG